MPKIKLPKQLPANISTIKEIRIEAAHHYIYGLLENLRLDGLHSMVVKVKDGTEGMHESIPLHQEHVGRNFDHKGMVATTDWFGAKLFLTLKEGDEEEASGHEEPTAHEEAKESLLEWYQIHQAQEEIREGKSSQFEKLIRTAQLHKRKKDVVKSLSPEAYELLADASCIHVDGLIFRFFPMDELVFSFFPMDENRDREFITVRPCLDL